MLRIFLSSVQELDRSFKGLYGEENGEHRGNEGRVIDGGEVFMRHFGWQYTAKLIAEYENCRTSEVYEKSTIECLNILSYIKAKNAYDAELMKRLK